jgi:hypothetical protein
MRTSEALKFARRKIKYLLADKQDRTPDGHRMAVQEAEAWHSLACFAEENAGDRLDYYHPDIEDLKSLQRMEARV